MNLGIVTNSFLGDDGELLEGGAERHLYHFSRKLTDLGISVTIWQPGALAERRQWGSTEVVTVPVSSRQIWTMPVTSRAAAGVDAVHFQYLDRVPSGAAFQVTATSHGVYWDQPFDKAAAGWYPHGRVDALLLPGWRRYERLRTLSAVARCRSVLATDTTLLRLVQSERPQVRDRLTVIPNFSDFDGSERPEPVSPQAQRMMETVARCREERRPIVLVPRNLSLVQGAGWLRAILRQVHALMDRSPEFIVTGRLVGRGAQRSALQTLESEGEITCLGGLQHNEMPLAYGTAEVVLIPSFAQESTSIAALEAMSFGRPLVATNVGGLNDIIDNGISGVLASPTPKAIAQALARVLNDPPFARKLGEEAAARARSTFSLARWEAAVEVYAKTQGWL